MLPRLQDGPRGPQDGPRGPQDGPKTAPRQAKTTPRPPTGPNLAHAGKCKKTYGKLMILWVPGGSRRRLGVSWGRLGVSWRRLGAYCGHLGASWRRLGREDGAQEAPRRPNSGPRRPQDGPKTPLGCVPTIEGSAGEGRGRVEGGSREGWRSHFGRPGSPGEGGRGVGKQVEEGSRWI